ncbi:MAG: SRPBCC family protein [Chloroflexota bacterium]|nr:SRPBCC family protein [Chloroflexota bacterium]
MRVQQSIEISAPPEKVWPFLVEPEKVLKWWTTLEKFEPVGERRGSVGAAFYVEERAGGPPMKMSFGATEWVENEKITLHMTAGKNVKGYEQSLTLEAVPTGSRFTFMEDVQLP